MKTTRGHVAQLCLTFLAFTLISGCGKTNTQDEGATKQTAGDGKLTPTNAIFNPKRAPNSETAWSKTLRQALDSAGEEASRYQTAMPYERLRILEAIAPKLKHAFELYAAESQQSTNLVNLAAVLRVDSRFASLPLHPKIRGVMSSDGAKSDDSLSKERETISGAKTPGLTDAPNIGDKPAVSVEHLHPDTIVKGIADAGNAIAQKTDSVEQQAELTREAVSLVDALETKNENPSKVFALSPGESLNVRAAKIGVKALYQDFLQNLVAYKGSLFVGAFRKGGGLQIWELKQPFAITTERQELSEEARLNAGIEITAQFSLLSDAEKPLGRKYENGFWGIWETPPGLNPILVTKNTDWTIQRKPYNEVASFCALSAAQIDAALEKSETTTDAGKALAAANNGDMTGQLALLKYYCAHDEDDKAVECSDALVKANSSSADLKSAAAALSELLFRLNPQVGEDFYHGKLFGYYSTFKNYTTMDPDFKALGAPPLGSDAHPYKQIPSKVVAQLINVYRKISDQESNNADAQFDISLLSLLSGISQRDRANDANADFMRSAVGLSEALAKSQNNPPSSGRDFASTVRTTPTFVLLHNCTDSDVERQWTKILSSLGLSDGGYFQRFSKAITYEAAGY